MFKEKQPDIYCYVNTLRCTCVLRYGMDNSCSFILKGKEVWNIQKKLFKSSSISHIRKIVTVASNLSTFAAFNVYGSQTVLEFYNSPSNKEKN